MVLLTKSVSVEEFDQFVELPENADKLFEFIGGEIVEGPSNAYASEIAGKIFGKFYIFLRGKDLGHLTGKAGGYMVAGERYAPDVAFISKARQPELAREGYNPNPPDLAVEVDFPSTYQSQKTLFDKILNYRSAGTTVWVWLPETKEVNVYAPNQPRKNFKIDGVLDGGTILPGLKLAIKDIFPPDPPNLTP